jgi:hypothetical protein
MSAALSMGSINADVVAVEARQALVTRRSPPPPVALPVTAAETVTTRRAAPSLAGYDRLLTGATR